MVAMFTNQVEEIKAINKAMIERNIDIVVRQYDPETDSPRDVMSTHGYKAFDCIFYMENISGSKNYLDDIRTLGRMCKQGGSVTISFMLDKSGKDPHHTKAFCYDDLRTGVMQVANSVGLVLNEPPEFIDESWGSTVPALMFFHKICPCDNPSQELNICSM